jgi:hypothetical protein
MLAGIDHVVVLVRDLAAATAGYERLGFTVTPGGEHAGGATHNALIGFDDGCYFELIAFKEPDKQQDHRWWARLAAGEGLVDYALRADSAAAASAEARERGLELAAVVDGARTRPDGERIAWRSLTSGRAIGTSPLPFAIEDVTPRELRVPGGEGAKHVNGATGVVEVIIVVRDLDAAGRDITAMLGSEAEAVDGGLVFTTGEQKLRFVQPGENTPHDGVGLSMAEHLETRGEGPYEVVLKTASGVGALVAVGDAFGARIRLG